MTEWLGGSFRSWLASSGNPFSKFRTSSHSNLACCQSCFWEQLRLIVGRFAFSGAEDSNLVKLLSPTCFFQALPSPRCRTDFWWPSDIASAGFPKAEKKMGQNNPLTCSRNCWVPRLDRPRWRWSAPEEKMLQSQVQLARKVTCTVHTSERKPSLLSRSTAYAPGKEPSCFMSQPPSYYHTLGPVLPGDREHAQGDWTARDKESFLFLLQRPRSRMTSL